MKIFLIGPMGSGKSKIGKILSDKLDLNLFDIDKEIERSLGLSINEIFKSKGEGFFRSIETKFLRKSKILNDSIISTGGGVIEKQENLKLLEDEKNVIFLNCSVDSQFNNTKGSSKRPLLNTNNPKLVLKNLYEKRIESYKKVSKLELLSDSMSNEEIANKIIDYLK
tara:strand:+ start:13323 stop:13823 length:501 start_codon:yes stop_codon:yes gene_type:complete